MDNLILRQKKQATSKGCLKYLKSEILRFTNNADVTIYIFTERLKGGKTAQQSQLLK